MDDSDYEELLEPKNLSKYIKEKNCRQRKLLCYTWWNTVSKYSLKEYLMDC